MVTDARLQTERFMVWACSRHLENMSLKELLERLSELGEMKANADRNVTEAEARAVEMDARYEEQYADEWLCKQPPRAFDPESSTDQPSERLQALMAIFMEVHKCFEDIMAAPRRAALARAEQASVAAMQAQAVLALALARAWTEAAAAVH